MLLHPRSNIELHNLRDAGQACSIHEFIEL
jgi:hypothetical protein